MHIALEPSHSISSDVLPDVYSWFFSHDVFTTWRDAKTSWQLHCIGGPGAGKTTLTALIIQHLKIHSRARNYPIISIFVDQDVPDRDNHFLEDLLETVYHKLGENRFIEEDQSDDLYDDYAYARLTIPEGSRIRHRLNLIRKALHSRLHAFKESRAFLLLDGIDRCDSTLRLLLEEEIFQLQKMGLSVLQTSRLAVFEQDVGVCDHREHGDAPDNDPLAQEDREVLDLFLLCKECRDVLCFTCKNAGRVCENCGDSINMHESYDHVNIRISIPDPAMKKFIAWSLEREHGDLGLGSPARKPPLSPLGRSLMASKVSKSVQKHADDILEFSYGHIGIAKARLDLLHGMESLDSLEMRRDQLPASIVTMFDMGLRRIEAQQATQREIGLKALAAAAADDDGISVPDLRAQLERLGISNTRSGEEMLEATRGFLVATIRDDPQRLTVFNQNLVYYIEQRYHRAIHRASIQLNAPKARFEPQNLSDKPTAITEYKLARSTTGLQRIPEVSNQPFIIRKGTRAWT